MVIDLHVHTNLGGSDSSLTVMELIKEAKCKKLDAVCLTEHGPPGQAEELDRLSREHGILLIRGMEVSADLGHIIVFGLPGYTTGILKAEVLRRAVDAASGFMIVAHPFRRSFDSLLFKGTSSQSPTIEEAIALPIFGLVDGIEVANGGNTEMENLFALQVANRIRISGTGGSDAHSKHGIGCFVTVFDREIKGERDLIEELKAGRFYPARRLRSGELIPYEEELP